MYYELQKRLPTGWHIFPKMRIADMLNADIGERFRERLYAILPKHVDFLVCDAYFQPRLAIEVNGASHGTSLRMARDMQVKTAFEHANLPLEFISVGTNFSRSLERIKSLQ